MEDFEIKIIDESGVLRELVAELHEANEMMRRVVSELAGLREEQELAKK